MSRMNDHLEAASPRWRFRGIPFAVAAIGLIAILAVAWIDEDQLETGLRRMLTVGIVAIMVMLGTAWFLILSGARTAYKLGLLAGLVLIAAISAGSVRKVEFTGDMFPIVEFRWQEDRAARLEASLAARASAPKIEDPTAAVPLWPEFRGAGRTGVVTNVPSLDPDWQSHPPQPRWRHPCGGGYASFVIDSQSCYTIEQRRDREAIVAYDLTTGNQRWVVEIPALFSEQLGGDGPRATPTLFDGKIIALGATGILSVIDAACGEELWRKSILEAAESTNIEWGMSGSPLVLEDRIIVTPGAQPAGANARGVLTFALEDGSVIQRTGTQKGSYASPQLVDLAGEKHLLVFDAAGLAGLDPETTEERWRVAWTSAYDINASQPIALPANRLLLTSSTGAALVRIEAGAETWAAEVVWNKITLKGDYASPVVLGDTVYGIDKEYLAAIDWTTGARKWKGARVGHGQLLLLEPAVAEGEDGASWLLVLTEQGELILVRPTEEKYQPVASFQAIEGRTWNQPAVAVLDDTVLVLVRNHLEMAAYELPLLRPSPSPVSHSAKSPEEHDSEDEQPTSTTEDSP